MNEDWLYRYTAGYYTVKWIPRTEIYDQFFGTVGLVDEVLEEATFPMTSTTHAYTVFTLSPLCYDQHYRTT